MSGTVYQLPKVYYDSNIAGFTTNTPTIEQLAQWNAVKNNGLFVYIANSGRTPNWYGFTNFDGFIAYYYESNSVFGYFLRNDSVDGKVLAAYEYSDSGRYGYSPFNADHGITQKALSGFIPDFQVDVFNSAGEAYNAIESATPTIFPISYNGVNCTFVNAPDGAAVGAIVTVNISFPEGYGIVNPSADAYVTCNGVLVPSTYLNGVLSFTMPDPS